jgi:hypothetical protein
MRPSLRLAGLGVLCILLAGPAASAGPTIINLDSFASGSNLGGNGITAQGPAPSTATATDTGLSSVLGGNRLTTVNMTTGGANSKVSVKIGGGSAKLEYKSSNGSNIATGNFSFLYDGSSAFPTDFSSVTNFEIDVFNQDNPAASTLFKVTLTDTSGHTSTQTAPPLVGNSNGATILFPLSSFPTPIDLTHIKSVLIVVDPTADTNLQLTGLKINATAPLPPPNPGTGTVPEPASLTLVLVGGTLLGAWGFRRRMKAKKDAA